MTRLLLYCALLLPSIAHSEEKCGDNPIVQKALRFNMALGYSTALNQDLLVKVDECIMTKMTDYIFLDEDPEITELFENSQSMDTTASVVGLIYTYSHHFCTTEEKL